MDHRCNCGHHTGFHAADGCFHAKAGWNNPGRCACRSVADQGRGTAVFRYESVSTVRAAKVPAGV
jgi:hypothetical protein